MLVGVEFKEVEAKQTRRRRRRRRDRADRFGRVEVLINRDDV